MSVPSTILEALDALDATATVVASAEQTKVDSISALDQAQRGLEQATAALSAAQSAMASDRQRLIDLILGTYTVVAEPAPEVLLRSR